MQLPTLAFRTPIQGAAPVSFGSRHSKQGTIPETQDSFTRTSTKARVTPPTVKFGAYNALHQAVNLSNNKPGNQAFRDALRSATTDILNEQDDDGFTPLHYAALNGDHLIVRTLLNKSGIIPDKRSFAEDDENPGVTPKELANGLNGDARLKTLKEFNDKGF